MRRLPASLYDAFRDRLSGVAAQPVIIIGNQKSGTSAIAHLIAEYAGLLRQVDVPPFWLSEKGAGSDIVMGTTSFLEVYRRSRRFFVADLIKEPAFTFYFAQVRQHFPRAAYLQVIRDPRNNIRSILNRWQVSGNQQDLPPEELVRRALRPELWGGEGENYIGRLALKWNAAARVALENQDVLRLVRYEDFLSDKIGCIAGLAESLGLSQRSRIDDKIDVAYQPRGDSSVSWEEFFGAQNLKTIETLCGAHMAAFGYAGSE